MEVDKIISAEKTGAFCVPITDQYVELQMQQTEYPQTAQEGGNE